MRYVFFVLLLCVSIPLRSQTGIYVPQMKKADSLVQAFMTRFQIPGLNIAISKNGQLIYDRGFGNADFNNDEPMTPHHRYRLASVTKLITTVAIMQLYEEGILDIEEKVFGSGGILEQDTAEFDLFISDDRIRDITVRHLLEHSSGWNRSLDCSPGNLSPYPFGLSTCDPTVFPLHVTESLGLPNPVKPEDYILFQIAKGLDFTPGTAYAYSNIGFITLGRIIEAKTGLSYETYVQSKIFDRIGACDFAAGRTLYADKLPREVDYHTNNMSTQGAGSISTMLSAFGSGALLPLPYGPRHIESNLPSGGLVGTAADLVRFLTATDRFNTKPDILSPATINKMVTPSTVNSNHALGWYVNSNNNWWHTGYSSGVATFVARTNSGYTWAVMMNKAGTGNFSSTFWSELDDLPWNCISGLGTVTHDFAQDTFSQVTGTYATNFEDGTAQIKWDALAGKEYLVVLEEANISRGYPKHGRSYIGSVDIRQPMDSLGQSQYVLHSGTSLGQLDVTGLQMGQAYQCIVYPYIKDLYTLGVPVYSTCHGQEASIVWPTNTTTLSQNMVFLIAAPNPSKGLFTLYDEHLEPKYFVNYKVFNSIGREIPAIFSKDGTVDLGSNANGLYFLAIVLEDGTIKHLPLLKAE